MREWKQHDRNQYEKYKKEDQPVIDKLDDLVGKVDHIGKELIHSIENEHDNKQLVPKKYDFDVDTLFPIPSTPSESSFEKKLYESPDTPKRLELEKQLKAIEAIEKKKWKKLHI